MFSVLMPVYFKDDPKHLLEALRSICTQTILPDELVVVHDGEIPSQIRNILLSFLDESLGTFRVKIVGYEHNMGLGYALNFGLNHCENEIIFRMDADDICRDNRFELQINAFIDNPEVALIGGIIEEFNEIPGDLNIFRTVPLSTEDIRDKTSYRCPFNHMTVAFRKKAVFLAGSYKPQLFYEDYYLWFRLLKNHNCLNLPHVLVDARIGQGMIKRRSGLSLFRAEFSFQKRLHDEKLINTFVFLRNVLIRCPIRLIPPNLLSYLYKSFLRSNLLA